jgi:hypothetical protein
MPNFRDEQSFPRHRHGKELVRRRSQLVSHLNRIFGEINAALIAIAIGLAVLDYICWLQLEISAALGRGYTCRTAVETIPPGWPPLGKDFFACATERFGSAVAGPT